MLRAGLMDRRISLRHYVPGTQDANGGFPSAVYTEYAALWARKEEISGREFFSAQTKNAENTVRFTIRYRSDVVATDRLTCEGKDYDITQTSENGRRESLTIFARVVES